MEPHRPGPLKQRNKVHKGPKKRQRKDSLGSVKSFHSSSSLGSKKGSSVSRTVRKNQLAQLRKLKREELLNARRGFATAPILISVIDFSHHIERFTDLVKSFDQTATVHTQPNGHIYLDLPKFRTRYQIVCLDRQDLFASLDIAKISDILLVIHSTDVEQFELEEEIAREEFAVLDAIYNHCLPQTVHSVIGMNDVPNPKQKDRIKKALLAMIDQFYKGTLDANKLRTLDNASDLAQLFHYCSNVKRKQTSYCARRAQLLAEQVLFTPNQECADIGTLVVDGYVRSNPLNVNSLAYIPEFGEFQIDLIESISNPYQSKQNMIEYRQRADPNVRSSLERENPVETIFEEEMRSMEEDMKQSVVQKKKVPKGTSDYQAAWIVDSEDEDIQSGGDSDGEEEMEQDSNVKRVRFAPVDEEVSETEDLEELETEPEHDVEQMDYDEEINLEEDAAMLTKFKEQRMYEMFPDEIDTPVDKPARERFSKYRGLKSFRTSTWDSAENLPPDYSRIFQFENFNRTKKRIFKTEAIGADPGYYVRVYLINVPRQCFDYYQKRTLVLFELLAHEHKMSVQNVVLKKVSTFAEPIRSKERLVFHIGCRRFAAKPIFSAHTTGDKHKFEKFLRNDIACVATIYAPITFPPAPVLVYKEYPDGTQALVATGSLLDCSPDRLVIKRYVLSGHPFKINRKHAVVRYMFFNRDDILWFRPVELRTKYGRRGHILEPLGTHGHMKCIFDHQLNSQDTVLMTLYKRVFPKWYYETKIHNPVVTAMNC